MVAVDFCIAFAAVVAMAYMVADRVVKPMLEAAKRQAQLNAETLDLIQRAHELLLQLQAAGV